MNKLISYAVIGSNRATTRRTLSRLITTKTAQEALEDYRRNMKIAFNERSLDINDPKNAKYLKSLITTEWYLTKKAYEEKKLLEV